MIEQRTMKFTAACLHYFGKLDINGKQQTNSEFMQEIRELDSEDRAYFKKHFPAVGITIED